LQDLHQVFTKALISIGSTTTCKLSFIRTESPQSGSVRYVSKNHRHASVMTHVMLFVRIIIF